jgi:pyridoxamine 5'-phosphate oxidase
VDDPFELFREWFDAAGAAGVELPEAMTLATATPDGSPSGRTILLKGVDERGFVFFTNYESRKGRELEQNPYAALVFVWHVEPRRQVIVRGRVERVPQAESEAYFRTRPLGSRLATWASRQSEVIPDRGTLERAYSDAEKRFGEDPPLPPWWGGYVLAPEAFEFWENRPNRLHERLRYTRAEQGDWMLERLSP